MNTIASAVANGTVHTIERGQQFKVDVSRGARAMDLNRQWANRPADERFVDLNSLAEKVGVRADQSRAFNLDVRDIRVLASNADVDQLRLEIPGIAQPAELTNWSFGQACSLLGLPAGYLRKLPASLAGVNMQFGMRTFREELVKGFVQQNGVTELRALTGPNYGRIMDIELVKAVRQLAGNGTGDADWKIPGQMDWARGEYNPWAPVTIDSTTLYASDRDVFMFLVDDTHPIEIGKLPNGNPDLIFRGFYVWNSEVGSKTLGISTFLLRGVCANRTMWGVEGQSTIALRHTSGAPAKFASEVRPILESYAHGGTTKIVQGVQAAKAVVVARDDDQRADFLGKQDFTKSQVSAILDSCLQEEGHPAESIWDMVQGITAVARSIPHQDDRVAFERRAGKLLDKVAA